MFSRKISNTQNWR